MTRVVWTEPAVSDLNGIHAYIARDAEVYADATVLEIFEAVDRLAQFPCSGRVVPELDEDNTREIIVGSYRVMYDTSGEVVRILAVVHGARLFPRP
jgi:toxin ParE1/3/4